MADYVGKQLGNYRLERLLGQGGFADVYLGKHIYLNTQAAIKLLQTRLAQDDLETFLKEARTVSGLIHPHIVRVLEFGVEEGTTPFLVMDYAPNGTLRQRHPKGTRLAPATIIPYVKQVASALQYAHDRKLIHRDVKPENMLLGHNNEILLSDFGIALVAQSSRYQSTQEVVGTLAYMAPEQLHGKPVAASDQYALGIVVYEWLTGERPFHGSFAEIASQHVLEPPSLLREKVPEITSGLEEVVHRALAKDPQQRFIRVEAFATALEQAYLSSKPLAPFVVNPPIQPSPPPFIVNPSIQPGQAPQQPFGINQPRQPSSPNFAGNPAGQRWQPPYMSNQPGPGRPSSPNFAATPQGQAPPPPYMGNSPAPSPSSPDYGAIPPGQPLSPPYMRNAPTPSSPNYSTASLGQTSDSTYIMPHGQASQPVHRDTTSGQYPPPASPMPPSQNGLKPPKRGNPRRKVVVVLAVVVALALLGSALLFAFSQKGALHPLTTSTLTPTSPSSNNTPAPGPSVGATDTSSPGSGTDASPTVTIVPTIQTTPGAVLYQANWASGLNGWAGSQDWKVLNGELLNDGTDSRYDPQPTIVAPYIVEGTADYAVESRIRVVRGGPCFDAGTVRGDSNSNGWHGYKGVVCNGQVLILANNETLTQTPFDPGTTWHVYRLEVKGTRIRFYVDGGLSLETYDNRYLTGGQTGLKSGGTQLAVSSFKIIAL